MEEFILKYWLEVLFSAILSGLVLFIKTLYSNFKKERKEWQEKLEAEQEEQKLLKGAMLALLHDRIYQVCQESIRVNGITLQELDNLNHLYKGYSALGGNGTGEEMYKRCTNLPLITIDLNQVGDSV